jgi:subtilase family protein
MLLALLTPFLAAFAAPQEPLPNFLPQPGVLEFSGRMIARPVQNDPLARSAALAEVEDWVLHAYPEVDEYILQLPEGVDENHFAAQLMASSEWEYVHPDWICYPIKTPDDPLFGNQWHHATIQSELAWDLISSASGRIASWTDTGVDLNHPDLAASLLPGYNAVDQLTQQQGGDLQDINGHGTLTGGTIGAIGNNGIGVAGASWDIKLLPVRVSNISSGGAYLSDLENGARWAVENGATTISASYSGVENASIQTTGAYVRSLGGLYFYAAGNSSANHSTFDWADVVVVGATDQADTLASFSSYGTAVDLTAPGVGIWTTQLGGGFNSFSGTSLSTPLANGVAAMLWAANPYLDTFEVESRLYQACDDLGAPGEDTTYGWGRTNMNNAVHGAVEGNMDLTAPVLNAGSSASFTVSGAPAVSTVYLTYSLVGPGITEIPALQTNMGLDAPVLATQTTSDAAGNAAMSKFIPAGTAGTQVWMQVLTMGDTSDIEMRVIQ